MGEIRQAILQPENIHVLTQLVALSMLQELDLAKYTGNGDNDNANTDNSGSGPVETDSNTKEGSTSSTSANTGVAKQCNGDNDPLCLYDNHPRLPSLLADGQNLFSSLVSGNPLRASVLAQFIRKTWAHKGNNIVIFGAPMPNHVRRLARQAAVKSAYRAVLSCMFGVYPLRLSLYQWLAKQAFSLYIQLFKVNVVGPMMSQLNQTETHRSSQTVPGGENKGRGYKRQETGSADIGAAEGISAERKHLVRVVVSGRRRHQRIPRRGSGGQLCPGFPRQKRRR